MRYLFIVFIILGLPTFIMADDVYNLHFQKEATIIAPAILLSAYSLYRTSKIAELDTTEINNFTPNNVNSFDRFAITNYNPTHATISDVLLGATLLSPLVLLTSDVLSNNRLAAITIVTESYMLTSALTSTSKLVFQRKRPYVYNHSVPISIRRGPDGQLSFFSGHTALAFTGAILTARMYNDTHSSNNSWYVYGGAVTVASTIGYFRVSAGRHFPSDVLFGAVVGTASALVISEVHKVEKAEQVGGRNMPLLYLRLEF